MVAPEPTNRTTYVGARLVVTLSTGVSSVRMSKLNINFWKVFRWSASSNITSWRSNASAFLPCCPASAWHTVGVRCTEDPHTVDEVGVGNMPDVRRGARPKNMAGFGLGTHQGEHREPDPPRTTTSSSVASDCAGLHKFSDISKLSRVRGLDL